jgi:hypothetical protein
MNEPTASDASMSVARVSGVSPGMKPYTPAFGFMVQGAGFRFQGLGFRVWGWGVGFRV